MVDSYAKKLELIKKNSYKNIKFNESQFSQGSTTKNNNSWRFSDKSIAFDKTIIIPENMRLSPRQLNLILPHSAKTSSSTL